ncbi:MAG: galactose-1-phosphate uridylyltransferase [Chloroflexi bacterium]|nr:galactose-1-phosphate uridylyltransferase [Chloroflexota bacterium]
MPELRRDPLTGRWVVIATERARRPQDFVRQSRARAESGDCPFCEGHEAQTPAEVMAYRPADLPANGPGWQVRVVPNLYPAFEPATGALDLRRDGLYLAEQALGAHEVLLASPQHVEEVAKLPLSQFELLVRAYIDRYRAHAANPLIQYIQLIMNYGREAGASRDHPHSQLFAVPLVPSLIDLELARSREHFASRGECLLCGILRQQLAEGERVVLENERFAVFAPFASRWPFELWLVPRRHEARFERLDDEGQELLARALKETLGKVFAGLNDPPFNYWLHTAPTQQPVDEYYHWHLELAPKLAIAAGFELGTDVMINTALPEEAAGFLRTTPGPA